LPVAQTLPQTILITTKSLSCRLRPDAYADIEMPRNSPTGFICAFFATVMGIALIWHIWWMVGVAALGAYATFVVFAWRDVDEYIIPAETVARVDRANRSARSAALARR
jgi:cytochrome o ubiquinol oxidase subunit I